MPYGPFRLGIFHKCLQPPEYLHIAQFSQRRCRRLSYVWLAACEGSQKLILVSPVPRQAKGRGQGEECLPRIRVTQTLAHDLLGGGRMTLDKHERRLTLIAGVLLVAQHLAEARHILRRRVRRLHPREQERQTEQDGAA